MQMISLTSSFSGLSRRDGRGRMPLCLALFSIFLGVFAVRPQDADGYSPDDPVIQQMVNRGVAYLEANPLGPEGSYGEVILIAYAHMKCRHDSENPIVKAGIQEATKYAAQLESGAGHSHKENYEVAVAVLLLAEVDAERYRHELEVFQERLLEGQFPVGGFGYHGEKDGDVSQTQYVVLAIWTLDRNGIKLDYKKVVDCLQWLLRVQDIDGAWPYKGIDPGPGRPNVKQASYVGMSMGLAGGSSVLIAADALRLWGETNADENDPGIVGLPAAIKLYVEDANLSQRKKSTSAVPVTQIKQSMGYLQAWRQKNPYARTQSTNFHYYVLYTMERFESFIEIMNGSEKDKSPDWYNTWAGHLKEIQETDGSWGGPSFNTNAVNTAFALMFLIRSTQKTIFSMSAGTLEGGYGLPKDTTNIRVDGTQIKGEAVATQVTDLLKILESDGAGDTEGKSLPEDLELDPTPDGRRAQLDRLERLVRGSKSWQARRVAAKLLGKSDELRVAPALIYALSDPDKVVQRYARDGLRFISRKFEGYGMPDDPDDAQIDQAQRAWRDWYRSTDPTYVFLDYDL